MELLSQAIDIVLHLDVHLANVVAEFGVWTYVILAVIVFCETGLVFTPFLPGDSLLFATGAIAAAAGLDVRIVLIVLAAAAILGDTVNYWAGSIIGGRVFRWKSRFINHEHLLRAREFYERHGGKTIVLARFLPIIRTFAPFVAGVAHMRYANFVIFNVLGGVLWVFGFVLLGYFFGALPVVKENFSLLIVAIVVLSVVPVVLEFVRARFKKN